jgi:hypothetical protein
MTIHGASYEISTTSYLKMTRKGLILIQTGYVMASVMSLVTVILPIFFWRVTPTLGSKVVVRLISLKKDWIVPWLPLHGL